jgi:hypothetical protein
MKAITRARAVGVAAVRVEFVSLEPESGVEGGLAILDRRCAHHLTSKQDQGANDACASCPRTVHIHTERKMYGRWWSQ